MSERLIPLGEIVTTHGIGGWLKLKPYNPRTTALFPPRGIILERNGNSLPGNIEAARRHKGHFLLKLSDIDGIDQAEKWIGATVSIPADELSPLEPEEFYHYQIVGFEVFDLTGRRLGVLTRVWFKAGGDLFVVSGETREYLIPAVKEMIEKVDLPGRRIIVDPPEGLLDL